MKILILSAAPGSYATRDIVLKGQKRGHEMIVKDPAFLYLLISDKVAGYDRVYDGYGQEDRPIRLNAKGYDAIIPRIGINLAYGCSVLEHLNRNLKIFSTQTSNGIKTAADKLISQQKISQAKIRVPQTVLGDRAIHPAWMIEQVGGLPAIAKGLTGSQGKTVFPLNDEYQTNVFLKNFSDRKENLLLQNFIDSGAKDIRAIVIDGKVIVAMERTAREGELRANISQGGTGRKVELSEEDKTICVDAARVCGLEVAGVDIMKDKKGKTFVIEVNGNYGYHIQQVTGVDISTPLIEYCERNHKDGNMSNNTTDMKASGFSNPLSAELSSLVGRPVHILFGEGLSKVVLSEREYHRNKTEIDKMCIRQSLTIRLV
ncbi:RimK family alpha-L-glutamate ligase [Mangrovibacterium sp.]|uniref:ATP-grasp domain-containing protein n=1 Tax=Mangrovibacterium sp. TaxID=1961364 RepID=UPI0035649EFD